MPKTKIRKLHKNIVVAFQRLHQRGALLCRQFSDSDEAKAHGGDYIYFTVRDNVKFPTGAGRFLIEHNLVEPGGDGLFADTPKTFRAVDKPSFEAFRQDWEAPQHGNV